MNIVRVMQAIKKKQCISNIYIPLVELQKIVDSNSAGKYLYEDAVSVCVPERFCIRMYWYTPLERLRQIINDAKKDYPDLPIIFEVIDRSNRLNSLSLVLGQFGVEEYKLLNYMSRQPSPQCGCSINKTDDIFFAALEDANEIYEALYDIFDPLVSHLPTFKEVTESIGKKEITAIRSQGKLAAFAIFQRKGSKNKYLYQIAVKSEFRGLGFGKVLLQHELLGFDSEDAYSLWVEADNNAAISLYKKYGFSSSSRNLAIYKIKEVS